MGDQPTKIAVVGPCCAGKSTLIAGLQAMGYHARQVAQEHSFAPAMWASLARPDALIYLDVSYRVALERRRMNWTEADHAEQRRRLRHAREHADFYLHTDGLSLAQVLEQVRAFLDGRQAAPDA